MERQRPRYGAREEIGGTFHVVQVLQGGMGDVYLCVDVHAGYPCVLKTFRGKYLEGDPELRRQFEREAASWVRLGRHPNLVQCFAMRKIDNLPFLHLEWVFNRSGRGSSLRQWLRAGSFSLRTALDVALDVCCGLEHAARRIPGFVHRDLKPENILLADGPVARITDFGLAIATADPAPAAKGQGSAPYVAPEQLRGEALDVRADIYALGGILFEMLSGRCLSGDEAVPELPDGPARNELNAVLAQCLAKRRDDRFPDCLDLRKALTAIYERQLGCRPEILEERERFSAFEHTERGVALDAVKRYEDALADHDRALELAPQLAVAHVNRGDVLARMGRSEEAVVDYTRAIVFTPQDARPYVNRGIALEGLGRRDEALGDYDRAVTIVKPLLVQAFCARGTLQHQRNEIDAARRDFELALALDPGNPRVRLLMGTLEISLGNLEKALPYLQGFVPSALPRGEITDLETMAAEVENATVTTFGKAEEERSREERAADVIVAWIRTPSWPESKAFLEGHPELVRGDLDEGFSFLRRRHGEHLERMQSLADHRQLLLECRLRGIEAAYAIRLRPPLPPEEVKQVFHTITGFLELGDPAEQRRYLEGHPELLTADADLLLSIIREQLQGDNLRLFDERREIIARCRDLSALTI